MASDKALYWMAVGVMALGVGNHFVQRFDGRCLTDRAMATIQRLSGESGRVLAMAETSAQCPRTQQVIARAQAKLATMQSVRARQELACARLQAKKAQLQAMAQMQQMRFSMVESDPNFSVEMPEIPAQPVRVFTSADPI